MAGQQRLAVAVGVRSENVLEMSEPADELSITQEIESTSIFGLATHTKRLSLDTSIDPETRERLANFAERIFTDLERVKMMKMQKRLQ